ncbi:ubiquinol-cytochrome c reductase core subunit 1 [Coemansia brasiliensis]|uniref:Cytochrome b-c1 complex subunit 2, mitochondrial n=1 Tax=Coemansia brasiliensis TaxID=2650707 RepID=A0A9W8I8Y0_9FUNG|nr:ubiquinol-cytochrome c reductase core subunit 1 [Coemansia brasiliensis]
MYWSTARAAARRGYASAASAPSVMNVNGIRVAGASASSSEQLASLALVVNAGSRFETVENAGAAHFLKAFGFRDTQPRTSFRTIREAELNGATLTAEATRENIVFRVQCFRDAVPYFVDVLSQVAAGTKYAEHEFRAVERVVQLEAASAQAHAETRVLEAVHQAAFRGGLGNALYVPEGSPVNSAESVQAYARSAFARDRVAVVGTGIEAEELSQLVAASKLAELPASTGFPGVQSTSFAGGSQKVIESAAPVSHYALAFACAPEEAPVLARLLGTQRRAKWNVGAAPLAQAAAEDGFAADAFSFAYSDAALVGVLVSAPAARLRAAVERVAQTIQKSVARPSADSVQRAAAAAQVDAADQMATQEGAARVLTQVALGQPAATLEAVEQAASKLSASAQSVFASKPVAASVSLSQATPYVDTLGF